MKNKEIFKNWMTMHGEVHSREITKALSGAYWEALNGYDDAECERAFGISLKKSKFFPKPSELIEIIEGNRPQAPKIEAVAEQQWRIVLRTMGRGPFDDPITIRLCKRHFNYSYLRNMLEKDENWEQKRFCRSYELMAGLPDDNLLIEDVKDKRVIELTKKIPSSMPDSREKRIAKLRRQADRVHG